MAKKRPKSTNVSDETGIAAVHDPGVVVAAVQGPGSDARDGKWSGDVNDDHEEAEAARDPDREGIRLGFLIHDVSRMRRSAYDQFMKPLDVTRAQWWVLAHLSRCDGMMQTQLADALEVGKASLGDVIESLESGGWVSRRADPSDRRAKRVHLTKPAFSLIRRMMAMEHTFNGRILGDLSGTERIELARSLMKIKNAIARLAPTNGATEPDANH